MGRGVWLRTIPVDPRRFAMLPKQVHGATGLSNNFLAWQTEHPSTPTNIHGTCTGTGPLKTEDGSGSKPGYLESLLVLKRKMWTHFSRSHGTETPRT